MSVAVAPHPAASLSHEDRLAYLRIVSSMALADGHAEQRELGKLRRLAAALDLAPAATDKLFASLEDNRLDASVTSAQASAFRGHRAVRSYLVMDAIAIAFSDARLVETESHRIAELSHLVDVEPDEVYMMAGFVEKILFRRDADQRVLAAELGAAVGAPGAGVGLVQMVRRVAGEIVDAQAAGA